MHKPLFLLMACYCTNLLYGQKNIKLYISQNTIPISSFESPSTDYSDLEALGKAIGNASVVMLGEQDHGDAATFLAKAKIVKYLHEQKRV